MATEPDVIVMNRRSGRGERERRELEGALRHASVRAEVHAVEPARLEEAVVEQARRGARVVAVAGGDGSLRAAARVLAGTTTALAPIPTGTLNHFARRAGIADARTALRSFGNGVVREVAVGMANEEIFLNTCSCGGYADAVRRREKLRHAIGKWPAAVVGVAKTAWKFPLVRLTMESGSDERVRETPLLWVGMGYGSFPFSHEADAGADADVLEAVVFRASKRRDLARLAFRLLAGTLALAPLPDPHSFEMIHTRALRVDADGRLDATLDGEPLRVDPPLHIRIGTARLRVLVPAGP